MVQGVAQGEVVIGYSPMTNGSGILNRLVQYETWQTAQLYLSAAQVGQPYMAVGRNMGLHRTVFQQVNGFSSHIDLPGGTDDLLVQSLSARHRVVPVGAPHTWMRTQPPGSWRAWWRQKKRHISTGWRYRWRDQGVLAAWTLSYALPLGALGLGVAAADPMLILSALLIRGITQFAIFEKSHLTAGEQEVRPWVMWLDIGYGLYLVVLVPLLSLIRPATWK